MAVWKDKTDKTKNQLHDRPDESNVTAGVHFQTWDLAEVFGGGSQPANLETIQVLGGCELRSS